MRPSLYKAIVLSLCAMCVLAACSTTRKPDRLAEAERLFQKGQDQYASDEPAAEAAFQQSLEIRLAEMDRGDEVVGDTYHMLGAIQTNQRKSPEAEYSFRAALKIYDAKKEVDPPKIISVLNGLTSSLGRQHKTEEGLVTAQRSIDMQLALEPARPISPRAYRTLALLYFNDKQFAQAIPPLEEYIRLLRMKDPVEEDAVAEGEGMLNESRAKIKLP